MSSFAELVVMKREDVHKCCNVQIRKIEQEVKWWIFKRIAVKEIDDFTLLWESSAIEKITFDYSGYCFANYQMAYEAINKAEMSEVIESVLSEKLSDKMVMALVIFNKNLIKKLDDDKLKAFCSDEFQDDKIEYYDSIINAQSFIFNNLSKITEENGIIITVY